MKICEDSDESINQDFPNVSRGDLVEIAGYGVYILAKNPIGLTKPPILVSLKNGNLWSGKTTWGKNLSPNRVKIVTDDYCLKKIK